MKIVYNPSQETWNQLVSRPTVDVAKMDELVRGIFSEVKLKGDIAIKKYTRYFDRVEPKQLLVQHEEFAKAELLVNDKLKAAIKVAAANIEAFHVSQKINSSVIETTPGVKCWQKPSPIEKVGLYIPGGTAPLFSTVLMLALPARIAGCKEVILCTPPSVDGTIHPAILYAAKISGVTSVYKVGGIQAIAAMTLGTKTIPAVYKIFGPGNQYVTAAKLEAFRYGIAIDLPAGPSEVMVVADEIANPSFVAADLLSQAEHGPDSQVMLITWIDGLIDKVVSEIEHQIETLPRKDIARAALENSSFIKIRTKEEAIACINSYAPEHLILSVTDEDFFCDRIVNAGSVFVGNYSPESAGDYASGTNHTLPTSGYARMYSGVSIDSFTKKISFQRIAKDGLSQLAPVIMAMAREEKLEAHRRAVEIRVLNQ
ncbi:MAG: histidinol dehydrogenase [Bacteroidota bacterium]|nr:histidinol dehydrogenase [Bacteroidota bacterium]